MVLRIRLVVMVTMSALILTGAGYYFLLPNWPGNHPSSTFVPETTGSMVRANDAAATPAATEALVDASNRFAFELYAKLYGDSGSNIFFSPYSISAAFAMVYEGARNQTAGEMRSVFHFPQDDLARRASFAALYNKLNIDNEGYTLRTADAAWVQEGYAILKEYLGVVREYYMGNATNVDFKGAMEKARQTINSWVADHTGGRIKELFKPGDLDPLTVLALTNAIYFKGEWQIKFDAGKTTNRDFYLASGGTVKVPMMVLDSKDSKFNYLDSSEDQEFYQDKLKILDLPYEGENASMFVLLPDDNDLARLEGSLTPEKLAGWQQAMYKHHLDIQLPKFKMDCRYDLKKILPEMGMSSTFGPAPDLSGMNGQGGLFIKTAVHEANIDVNEQGTEAAAATGVGVALSGMTPSFIANHPFIFLIQDKATGTVLFMGRVTDPTAG